MLIVAIGNCTDIKKSRKKIIPKTEYSQKALKSYHRVSSLSSTSQQNSQSDIQSNKWFQIIYIQFQIFQDDRKSVHKPPLRIKRS